MMQRPVGMKVPPPIEFKGLHDLLKTAIGEFSKERHIL